MVRREVNAGVYQPLTELRLDLLEVTFRSLGSGHYPERTRGRRSV